MDFTWRATALIVSDKEDGPRRWNDFYPMASESEEAMWNFPGWYDVGEELNFRHIARSVDGKLNIS